MLTRAHIILLRAIWACALALFVGTCGAAAPPRVLCGPTSVLALRQAQPDFARLTQVAVTGQLFGTAWRVAVAGRPAHPWNVELRCPVAAAVDAGDALLLRLHVRGVALQAAAYVVSVAPFVQESTAPFAKLNRAMTFTAGTQWQTFEIPMQAGTNYPAGALTLTFHLGFEPQTLDLGGIKLLNYGRTTPLAALPHTGVTYDGRAPDAPWRTAAWARIARYRMAPLGVTVLDRAGVPLSGAVVRIAMQRHAFRFGCAMGTRYFAGPLSETDGAARYRATFTNWFNAAVFAGEMKWSPWQDALTRARVQATLAWFATQQMTVRGHCLVWPKWKWLPGALPALATTPDKLQDAVLDHITDLVRSLKGRISDYDVVNEPYTCRDLMDVLGPRAMPAWFAAARQADPHVPLYINDFGILSRRDDTERHRDHYEQTIHALLQQGAPLDGIGMQGHVYFPLCGPEELLATLTRFARLRNAIQITEHDVMVDDEQLQADYARDFLITVFSHPAVRGVYIWGFWDGDHWKRNALLYRRDWSLKPSGTAWRDLLFRQWWTTTNVVTDARGAIATRGFLGTYQLTVATPTMTTTRWLDLPQGGTAVVVRVHDATPFAGGCSMVDVHRNSIRTTKGLP